MQTLNQATILVWRQRRGHGSPTSDATNVRRSSIRRPMPGPVPASSTSAYRNTGRSSTSCAYRARSTDSLPLAQTGHTRQQPMSPFHDTDIDCDEIRESVLAGPEINLDSTKMAKRPQEVRWLGSLMSAGRALHDIHTTLNLLSYWPCLSLPTRHNTLLRLWLLSLTSTKGWPAAIHYDTQVSDKYIPVRPVFGRASIHRAPRRPSSLLTAQDSLLHVEAAARTSKDACRTTNRTTTFFFRYCHCIHILPSST